MNLRKSLCRLVLTAAMFSMLAVSASAAGLEYGFDGVAQPEYYGETSYEDTYGSQYNYGGINAVDYDLPEPDYGTVSNTSIGAMEKLRLPGIIAADSTGSIENVSGQGNGNAGSAYPTWTPAAFTSVSGMERSDGSIGTIKIPSLDINMKVWESETNTSMSKGLGHYSSTSGWDGNVGVCGHNRGAKYVIGSIKDLEIGDTIKYTTVYGTRTYAVTVVATIFSTDWSHLEATTDNRITLTTCLANQPDYRICVQAVEVN